jgi:hypothetical protein
MRNTHNRTKKLVTAAVGATVAAAATPALLFLGAGTAWAEERPDITQLYQDKTDLVVGWDGHEEYDHYNLRWSQPGAADTQVEISGGRSGSFRINNVQAPTTYTVKVQGCERILGHSECTRWAEDAITTQPYLPYGPDTCKQGFVWREAQPSDHICVTPQTRTQTAQENSLAATRRDPNGGAYGPDTCLQGFVWREAFSGDHVCVPPASRDQAASDNAAAASRRVVP